MTALAATVGAVGMLAGVAGFAWLLLARVIRSGSIEGLNLTTVAISWAASFLWGAYALLTGDTVNLVVSTAAGTATTLLSALVVIRHRAVAAMLLPLTASIVVSVAAVAAAILSGLHAALPLIGSVAAAVMLWPQAYTALRATDLTGVSPHAFAVRALFAGSGWIGHTIATGDLWFMVQFTFAIPPALIVAWRAWALQRDTPSEKARPHRLGSSTLRRRRHT